MNAIRTDPNPWLADHIIFSGYRWLSWNLIAVWLLVTWQLADYSWILAVTGLFNITAMLVAQRYIRIARRTPVLMTIDILYSVAIVLLSGGWESLFIPYAYSSLVLPALLFGWRGGIMSGLLFTWLFPLALWASGHPLSDQVFAGAWGNLLMITLVPPAFGMAFLHLVDGLRQMSAGKSATRPSKPAPPEDPRPGQPKPPASAPLMVLRPETEQRRSFARNDTVLVTPTLHTRTAEEHVEDLRRVIFTPLTTPYTELADAIEQLVERFGRHTGTSTRFSVLGRSRILHPIHRDLLVRLVQEALLNIQQHAHAATATLTLRFDANSVAILIQDNGIGLLDGTYERPGLHALRAMYYRLAEFGGRLDVFETEGGGVTVRATIPLE